MYENDGKLLIVLVIGYLIYRLVRWLLYSGGLSLEDYANEKLEQQDWNKVQTGQMSKGQYERNVFNGKYRMPGAYDKSKKK